jgi:hypothetical protein
MCTVEHLKAENLVIALGAPHRVGGRASASRRSNPLSRPAEKLLSVTSRSSTAKSSSPWLASRRSPPATVRSAVERGALVGSPCAGVKPPSRAVARDRVLSANELRLRPCDEIGWRFGPVVKLLIATAQCRDGVGTWAELDLDARTWLMPAPSDVAHEVPLSDYAVAALGTVQRINDCAFVFSTAGETAVDGYSRAKERLNDKIIELMRADAERAGGDPVGVQPLPHWTFHDLRRTAASHMARLGIALPVIEKILAHTSGSFGGIVGVYQRYEFVAEKRAAIEAWGKWLTGLPADAAANYVAFRAVVP